MKWSEWEPLYFDIVRKLQIDVQCDYRAAELLSEILTDSNPEPLLHHLATTIRGKDVVVFGSGPSLGRHLDIVMDRKPIREAVRIAADGAVSALNDAGMDCQFVVTDLDGNTRDILSAVDAGAIPIVHAHGDNMDVVSRLAPEMVHVLGSTQVEPLHNVFLWGGFTDGDRACFIISHYSPKRIILAGMDFGNVVGKWSKPGYTDHFLASPRKELKLRIAQDMLKYLQDERKFEFSFLE